MKQRFPKHLSYNYKFDLDHLPTKANDRLSLKVIIPAILIGLLMVLLGFIELNNGLLDETPVYKLSDDFRQPLVNNLLADYSFIILGLGIIACTIIAHIRYKKIYFNGRIFDVDFKGVFGEVEMFDENLRNYRGVRLRVEFFQYGIRTKNKYIVELEHIDPQKTIPLYIATDGTGIYDIWQYYAKRLGKPTIVETDEGLKVVDQQNLNKNLKTFIISNGLAQNYTVLPTLPQNLKYSQKDGKIILTAKKAFWDIRNIVVSVWLTVYTTVLAVIFGNYNTIATKVDSVWKFNLLLAVAVTLLLICLLWMFKREKIIIKDNRIILAYRFFLLSRKKDDMEIDEIKDIEIMYNPVNDRHYLALISQYDMAAFGAKMPLEDLQWVKKFLIREILR